MYTVIYLFFLLSSLSFCVTIFKKGAFESDDKKKILDVFNILYFESRKGKAILVLNNKCLLSDLTVIRDNMIFYIIKLVIWRQSFSVPALCCNSTATWNDTKWASWRKYNCMARVVQ